MKKAPKLQSMSARARTFWGVGIGLGVGLLFASLRHTGAVVGLERRLVDSRTRSHIGTRPPDPRIVLAVVTSLDTDDLAVDGYRWPWDLAVTAYAFDWMAEAGVKAVAVDVFQVGQGLGEDEIDPEKAGPEGMAAAKLAGQEAETLGAIYRRLENVVLAIELVSAGNPPPKRLNDVRAPEFAKHLMRVPPISTRPAFSRDAVNLPVVRLLRAATSVGFANADVDDDGTLRRSSPIALLAGKPVPSLSLAALLRLAPATVELGEHALTLGDATQRLDAAGTFLVNFRGGEDAYEQVRPADMIRAGAALEEWRAGGKKGQIPEKGTATVARLKGKLVVWGVNIGGIKDVVPTPIAKNFPGPEFQATAVDNLLHGDGRVEAPLWANLAILLGFSAFLGYVGGATRKRWIFLAMLVVLAVGTVLGADALFVAGWSIDLFSPVAALVVVFAGVSAFQLMTEGRRNKWLEGTFSQYLSPAVIAALKSDPTMLELGGREREITVIFSDVKSFTTLSEKLGPVNTVKLLNDYLTRQSAPVLADDGVIDKFIGDAVMAFFGDPVPVPDHAYRACRAALGCLAAVKDSDPMAHSLGLSDGMKNRIGIASGLAVVGNMGSDKRFSYTAMGDTVNLSSRLESANKAFGSRILLGPITYEEAKDRIVAKPLAKLRVVGKEIPVAVYELLALKEDADEATVRHVAAFTRAQAAVIADDFPAARNAIDEALDARPGDGPTAWLLGLLHELEEGKRRRPWDGTYVLDTK